MTIVIVVAAVIAFFSPSAPAAPAIDPEVIPLIQMDEVPLTTLFGKWRGRRI